MKVLFQMARHRGKFVVVPVPEPEVTLENLVALITPENRHDEVETGEPVGNEIW